jgi:carbamoylphosphate synthase large subunit
MLKIWSRFRKPTTLDKHVIVFGQHSNDWMSALHPRALVWKKIDNIKSVKFFSTANEIPKTSNRRKLNTVIIPLMESHLYEMPTNLKSLTSTPELVSLMADKRLLTENLITHGFAQVVPKTWTNPMDSTFPCVIKRSELNGGQGIQILKSFHELHTVITEPEYDGKSYFFQEFISSDTEYVCHIVALKGEILFTNYFECKMPGPEMIRRGDSPTTILNRGSDLNFNVAAVFKDIIKHLHYSGPCNIDFKLINGHPRIFEINPRLGGSLMVSDNVHTLTKVLNIIIRNANETDKF